MLSVHPFQLSAATPETPLSQIGGDRLIPLMKTYYVNPEFIRQTRTKSKENNSQKETMATDNVNGEEMVKVGQIYNTLNLSQTYVKNLTQRNQMHFLGYIGS